MNKNPIRVREIYITEYCISKIKIQLMRQNEGKF